MPVAVHGLHAPWDSGWIDDVWAYCLRTSTMWEFPTVHPIISKCAHPLLAHVRGNLEEERRWGNIPTRFASSVSQR